MKNKLEDLEVNVKIKLSALWASVTLCYLYGDYFELYVPKKTAGLVSGINMLDNPIKLFAATLVLAIPATMVCLCVLLKPRANRWLNMIFGIVFTFIMLLITANSITYWRMFYVFLAVLESVLTSLIVIYAWRWKKSR